MVLQEKKMDGAKVNTHWEYTVQLHRGPVASAKCYPSLSLARRQWRVCTLTVTPAPLHSSPGISQRPLVSQSLVQGRGPLESHPVPPSLSLFLSFPVPPHPLSLSPFHCLPNGIHPSLTSLLRCVPPSILPSFPMAIVYVVLCLMTYRLGQT